MLAGGAVWAKAKQCNGVIRQIGGNIPTGTPCVVCCVVKPLPALLLSIRGTNLEASLALVAVEQEHEVGVAPIRLVNVELFFGHGSLEKRVESPNAPKLL